MSLYAIGDLHLHFQSELKAPGQLHDRMPQLIPSRNVKDWILDPDAAKELLMQPQPSLAATRRYEQLSLF